MKPKQVCGRVAGSKILLGFSSLLILVATAHGQTNSWIEPVNQYWHIDWAWSLGVAPAVTHSAILITNANSKVVGLNENTPAENLTISNLTVSAPAGGTNTLQSYAAFPGALTILNSLTIGTGGALVWNSGTLQAEGLSSGQFRNDGDIVLKHGTVISTNALFIVGAQGTGTVWMTGSDVTVENGTVIAGKGRITLSNGAWRVGGAYIGMYAGAHGTVAIAGGTNTQRSFLSLGYGASTATGIVWLTGGELIVTNEPIRIGDGGVGQMTVSNGTWRSRGVYVGQDAGSQGTLTVAGGSHALNENLMAGVISGATGTVWLTGGLLNLTNATTTVGRDGVGQMEMTGGQLLAHDIIVASNSTAHGTFTITAGTNTVTGSLLLGYQPSATGTMWLKGGQLETTGYTTYVGRYGIGQMTVSNGTWLAHSVVVGRDTGSDGKLTIAGGTTRLTANLVVALASGSTGAVWLTGGELVVTNFSSSIGNYGVGRMTVSNGTWLARDVSVGPNAGAQGLLSLPGGTAVVSSNLVVGPPVCAGPAVVSVTGGSLYITNAAGNAVLEVRNGILTVSAGLLAADTLVITNSCATFLRTGGTVDIAELQLTDNLDADGDTLPNKWELDNGLDPLCDVGDNGAAGDPDGDGWTNAQEQAAGTRPKDNASYLRVVSVTPEGNDIRVTWTCVTNS